MITEPGLIGAQMLTGMIYGTGITTIQRDMHTIQQGGVLLCTINRSVHSINTISIYLSQQLTPYYLK